MRVIACFNPKGGVGKSTTAVHLALHAAELGHRTLIWDLDSVGAASLYLGIKPNIKAKASSFWSKKKALRSAIQPTPVANLELIPGDFKLRKTDRILSALPEGNNQIRKLLSGLKDDYDYCFLDCPAGFGLIAENALRASNALLVPVAPSQLAIKALQQVKKYVSKHPSDLKQLLVLPFFSIVDQRRSQHKELLALYANGRKRFLTTHIAQSSHIERMGHDGGAFLNDELTANVPRAYAALWKEMLEHLELHERVKRIKMW